jgi:Domain of unknown function (DUF4184)
MPLTTAHPVASILLRKPMGRFGVLSALIIGSMTPDFHYFIPLHVGRDHSHSLLGLVWYCLPMGLVSYWFFHRFFKHAFCDLLPLAVKQKIAWIIDQNKTSKQIPFLAVVLSLLVGSLTHIVWDSFTHGTSPVVMAISPLQYPITYIGDYAVTVYKVLQHGSSVVGTLVMSIWVARWYEKAPSIETINAKYNSRMIITATAIITIAYALYTAQNAFDPSLQLAKPILFLRYLFIGGVKAAGACMVVYTLWWHLTNRRSTAP